MAGYTRQSASSIVDGNTIDASPLNAEFNALQTAFDVDTGHTHDGTTGGGGTLTPISMNGLSANGIVVRLNSSNFIPRTLTGTANQITVTDGDGVGGNPTISLPNTMTMTGIALTNGTYNAAAINSPTILGGTINGSVIDNTPIGATTASTGKFTTFLAADVTTTTLTTTGATNIGGLFTVAYTSPGSPGEITRFGGTGAISSSNAYLAFRTTADGHIQIVTYNGTDNTTPLNIDSPLVLSTATGGSKGIGSLNATALYINGAELTSASTTSIGTSGAVIPLLNTANTWSADQTFNSTNSYFGGDITDAIDVQKSVISRTAAAGNLSIRSGATGFSALGYGTTDELVVSASGVTVGSPTGGAKGANTFNAPSIYLNGSALTSAATTAIGTSGAVIPLLDGANTFSGTNSFSGATSFTSTITAPTAAYGDNTTKVATMAAIIQAFTGGSSVTSPGYQKLPSGLIIQWGSVGTPASGHVTVTFPIAFPSTCLFMMGTVKLSGDAPAIPVNGSDIAPLAGSAKLYVSGGGGAGVSFWLALGV